jgi:hypothetical protein
VRAYHSASSDALGQLCPRAWWYRYGEGRKDPEFEWSAIRHYKWSEAAAVYPTEYGRYVDPTGVGPAIKAKQRSASLGKAMHSTLERWYDPSRGEPDWNDLPGRIAQSGLHLAAGSGQVPRWRGRGPTRRSRGAAPTRRHAVRGRRRDRVGRIT